MQAAQAPVARPSRTNSGGNAARAAGGALWALLAAACTGFVSGRGQDVFSSGAAGGGGSSTTTTRLPAFNTHIPPPGMPASEGLLSALPAAQNASGNWGKGVCTGGVWEDAPNAALETGGVLPLVQCWRQPPCIRWNYATPARCKAWPNDEDWPTADPYLPSNPPGQHSMKELLDTHWKDKTVVFVGDSINSLVYHAALCEAAKVYDISFGAHAGTGAGDLHTRLAGFHRTMNELRVKDGAMGGTLWLAGPPQMPEAVEQSRTIMVMKGWHMWKESDMEGIMAIADVIVVNYGLHYAGNVSQFEEAMPLMFKQLEEFASRPGKSAMFRETNVEHKNVDENSPEGTFLDSEPGHPDAVKVRGCQCRARREGDGNPLGVTMNAYVHDIAKNFPHVGIVPFYNLTEPRFDFHEAGYCAFEGLRGKQPDAPPPYCCDCTHFCYTPQFWKAFFHNMFEAHEAVTAAAAAGGR